MMCLSVEPWSSEQIVFCASTLGHHSSSRSSQLFAQLNQQGFSFTGAEVSAAWWILTGGARGTAMGQKT